MDGEETETLIYLVDDEPLLLEVAEASLTDPSWRLKKFNDPALAWESFRAERPKPALLLTDYWMGSMTGLELAALCIEAHPKLKVILASGTVGAEIANAGPVKIDWFLAKPFHPRQLLEAVQSLLPA